MPWSKMIFSGGWGEDFMDQFAQEASVKENFQPSRNGAHECNLWLESEISPIQMKIKVFRFESS